MSGGHHVVVGASIAGVSAAVAMRECGYEGRITVIDADPHTPYERPPLSKSADVAGLIRPILPVERYGELAIELILGTEVARLDRDRQLVVLADGTEITADQVLLATGVAARRLGVQGEGLANIHSLRDVDDARGIFDSLASGGPLVIVGGGFIGLEAAAVARELGIEVSVVEMAELPLIATLGPVAANLVTRHHESHGVRFYNGQTVTSFIGTGNAVEGVLLADGAVLPAATVIVGCGVVPNVHLAADLGLECAGGIAVDEHGRTEHPWVWAAGDVASQPHPTIVGHARIEHWDVAMRHGAAVGASMVGPLSVNDAVPYFWSDQYGGTLQMYGRGRPDDEIVVRDGATSDQFIAFWLRDGRVGAVAGLNEPKAIRAAKILVELGAVVPPEVLAGQATDLRALGRQAKSQPVVSV